MNTKKIIIVVLLVTVLVAANISIALAGSVTANGLTLTWPNYPLSGSGLSSCTPKEVNSANKITVSGIPAGAKVIVAFAYSSPLGGTPTALPKITFTNVTGGTLNVPVPYPNVSQWPVYNAQTGEKAIAMAATVQVINGATLTKLRTTKWWVRCLPDDDKPRLSGCTPGYWRQEQHFDSWAPTGYEPSDDFETVFGVDASFTPDTLLDAVWLGGGGEFALARHAVAALLNAAHPTVNYAYSVAEVIAGVQAAYTSGNFGPFKDALDAANNAGCPLN
jgi:hypothetical protein